MMFILSDFNETYTRYSSFENVCSMYIFKARVKVKVKVTWVIWNFSSCPLHGALPIWQIHSICGTPIAPYSSAVLALCEVNPPVTGGFPSQRASNVENISMSLCPASCLLIGTLVFYLYPSYAVCLVSYYTTAILRYDGMCYNEKWRNSLWCAFI